MQILASSYPGNAVKRKAQGLVDRHRQVGQDNRHDQAVDDGSGNQAGQTGVADITQQAGLEPSMADQHLLFEKNLAVLDLEMEVLPAAFQFRFDLFFQFPDPGYEFVDFRVHGRGLGRACPTRAGGLGEIFGSESSTARSSIRATRSLGHGFQ